MREAPRDARVLVDRAHFMQSFNRAHLGNGRRGSRVRREERVGGAGGERRDRARSCLSRAGENSTMPRSRATTGATPRRLSPESQTKRTND